MVPSLLGLYSNPCLKDPDVIIVGGFAGEGFKLLGHSFIGPSKCFGFSLNHGGAGSIEGFLLGKLAHVNNL